MTRPEKPSDFDWVTARAGCSALNMFELLKLEAAKNVEAIKAVTKTNGNEMPLSVFDNGSSFAVTRRTFAGELGVRFTLAQDEISVYGHRLDVSFTATLTLDDNGECRFLVDGTTLDRWQVLRRSLEPLFFTPER
jgi:hypothetical protein